MASFRTTVIVKLMTFWNFLNTFFNTIIDRISNFYEYIYDYIQGNNDIWLFIPNHTIPITLSNVSNLVEANWIYNTFYNTLGLNMISDDYVSCKFSWLSAKIKITDSINDKITEYYIDDFLENFTVITKENYIPSLYIIFMSWCAHNKYWFKADDNVEFEIIDDMGESIVLNIDENNFSLNIKHNKIYVVIDSLQSDLEVENSEKDDSIFYIDNSDNPKKE